MRLWQFSAKRNIALEVGCSTKMAPLTYLGMKLKNPILAGAGEPTVDYEHMARALSQGVGGVVTKSVSFSRELAASYEHCRWAILDQDRRICSRGEFPKHFTFFGRGGIPLEPKGWLDEIKKTMELADRVGAVVIGSVATGRLEDMVEFGCKLERLGIPAIEIDAGCPHPGEIGGSEKELELVTSDDVARAIVKAMRSEIRIPLVYKISPEVSDIVKTCQVVMEAGADGVVIGNRYRGFLVDIWSGRPILDSWGGIGGPWVLPLTLRWVSKVFESVKDITISGSNGVGSWEDIVQFIMAGATTVQVCSAIMVHGYGILGDMIRQVEGFMEAQGYSSYDEIKGIAVRRAKSYQELYSDAKIASIDDDLCTRCYSCQDACFYGGITTTPDGPRIVNQCKGCGMCEMTCPEGAIRLVPRTEVRCCVGE
ncbi:MAG TPA: 4Fe-4S binding protein [Clostridia bacterium]|nr:4Fe-4S binding protein [Clostridia bacterium]